MMDFLTVTFKASGVTTNILIPPLVSFIISYFSSMGGLSGAFMILPFQMSVLGYTAPSASSTNFLFNVIGIPGGVYRYLVEKRMFWGLTWIFIAGAMPGVLLGYYLRVKYFPDPKSFKFFVGLVLFYIAVRLIQSAYTKLTKQSGSEKTGEFLITHVTYSIRRIEYTFMNGRYGFNVPAMFMLALVVGMIGGVYGIGGGAIIAPICVAVFRLPVYTIAGAALMGTFLTSIIGVIFYSLIPMNHGMTAPPDWALGTLFGLGGIPGMYLGAKTQKYMPEKIIKMILAAILLVVSGSYIWQYVAR
jgi:hypothetical protein